MGNTHNHVISEPRGRVRVTAAYDADGQRNPSISLFHRLTSSQDRPGLGDGGYSHCFGWLSHHKRNPQRASLWTPWYIEWQKRQVLNRTAPVRREQSALGVLRL